MADVHDHFPKARHLFCAADYIDEAGNTISSALGRLPEIPFRWPGREYASRYLQGVLANEHIHRVPGVLTERKLIVEECPYRKEAGLIADDDFFYRVSMFTDVAGTGRPLAKFRLHKRSFSARADLAPALARDYLFQVRCYAKEAGPFSEEDRQLLFGLAVRFINQAFYEALVKRDIGKAAEALDQRRELDRMLPGFMRRRVPLWARPLWALAGCGGRRGLTLAAAYARSLHLAGRVRHMRGGRTHRQAASPHA